MIKIKRVKAIANAEMRITRRLLRYWIFLGFSYFIALIAYAWYSYWHSLYSSYSATVALCSPRFLVSYIGVYYLLIYVLGVVFLAYDVRARDKRERMDEVLDSRPYTNLELVTGRFLGILIPSLIPVLVLAVLIEVLGLILAGLDVPFGEPVEIVSLFGFLVVMGIPAVSFILSLVFLVTLMVRNRLVVAVLLLFLLGFDYYALYTLPINYGRLFDFFGILYLRFPSDIIPSVIDWMGLLQRFGVLLAAFGLLGISAAVHPRLDRSSRTGPALKGILVLAAAIAVIGFCHYRNSLNIKIPGTWLEAHADRVNEPVPDIQSISGNVKIIPGKALEIDIDLAFRTTDNEPLQRAVFSLNPGQKIIKALDASGQELDFSHENGLLEIILPRPLEPGEESRVNLSIRGIPDQRFAYLESALNPVSMTSDQMSYMELLGNEKTIFDPRFVALVPGMGWLPASGTEKGRYDMHDRAVDYFNADLSVDIPDDWLVAGPGRRHKVETGTSGARFRFSPPVPVPGVALIASEFESRSFEVEGVLMELLIHEKHTKNLEIMAEAGEHIRAWIKERLLEAKSYGLDYPYDALTLVEVPNNFRTYGGGWRMGSAMSPPGLLLMREMSFPTASFGAAFREPDDFKEREGGISKAKFDRLRSFFANDISGGNIFAGAAQNFFVHQTNARGKEGLALNYVMEILSTHLVTETNNYFSAHAFARGSSINLLIDRVADRYFSGLESRQRGKSVADAAMSVLSSRPEVWEQALEVSLKDMDPWDDPAGTFDVLALKCDAIARSIIDTMGRENLGRLLSLLREKYKGKSYTYRDMLEACKVLEYDMEQLLGDWPGSTGLPGFVVQDSDIYRLPDSKDGTPRYQLLFSVRNDEPVPGVFRFEYYYVKQDAGFQGIFWSNGETVKLAGRSAVQFGMVTTDPPRAVFLESYYSLNRRIFYVLTNLSLPVEIEEKEPIEGLEELPWAIPEEDFIVVDDLDQGFKIVEGEQKTGFRLNIRGTGSEETDQGLPAAPEGGLPAVWSRRTNATSWGKYRHTIVVIKAGEGEKKAVFTTSIPRGGVWELELHLPYRPSTYPGRKWGTWNLEVKDVNGGRHTIRFDSNVAVKGWCLAGSLDLPEGEVSVTLSDKTDGDLVTADAIRWSPLAEKN